MADVPTNRNYFLLANVLEKHQGRVIHWAACTGQRDESGTRLGPFFGYKVTTISPNNLNTQLFNKEKTTDPSYVP